MPLIITSLICFFLAALLSFYCIPTIINISLSKKFYGEPNIYGIQNSTPTLGGLAVFLGFILAATVSTYQFHMPELRYIFAALLIVLFMGLRNDLLKVSSPIKFFAELGAAIIICALGDIRFTDLYGILGIHQLNYWVSLFISISTILFLTNAINVLNNIDGLAAGISIIIATTFGIWFYIDGHAEYTVLCFSLTGALTSFFLYNVFGKTNKILFGDTGSLVTGIILSVFLVKFNEFNSISSSMALRSAPAISFAIVSIPVVDTLMSIILRIIQKRPIFKADQKHVQHKLLLLKLSHFEATLVLMITNGLIIAIAFIFQGIEVNALLFLIGIVVVNVMLIPFVMVRRKELSRVKQIRLYRKRMSPIKTLFRTKPSITNHNEVE